MPGAQRVAMGAVPVGSLNTKDFTPTMGWRLNWLKNVMRRQGFNVSIYSGRRDLVAQIQPE